MWSGSSKPCAAEAKPGSEAPPAAFPTRILSAPRCGCSASLPNRGSPPVRTRSKRGRHARHTAGSRGTFHEVRLLSAKSAQVIVMLVCLASTVRSQGFSPSQRFHPTRALRLCFASHPPIGFPAFRAFPTQPAVAPLDAPCSSVVTSSSGFKGSPPFFHRPSFPSLDDRCSNVVPCYEPVVPLSARRNITFSSIGRSRTARRERSRRLPRVNAQRLIARFSGVTTVNRSNFRLAWDANSRALLRLSVRTRSNAVKRTIEPMLS
jgi:hypothetical protein